MKIISGGQTGIDSYALDIAKEFNITTGGTACKGWLTEDGPRPDLANYGLVQCSEPGYPARTLANIVNSTLTIIIAGPKLGPGSKLTVKLCKEYNVPYLINPNPAEVSSIISRQTNPVINFAGTRASKLGSGDKLYFQYLIRSYLDNIRQYI